MSEQKDLVAHYWRNPEPDDKLYIRMQGFMLDELGILAEDAPPANGDYPVEEVMAACRAEMDATPKLELKKPAGYAEGCHCEICLAYRVKRDARA